MQYRLLLGRSLITYCNGELGYPEGLPRSHLAILTSPASAKPFRRGNQQSLGPIKVRFRPIADINASLLGLLHAGLVICCSWYHSAAAFIPPRQQEPPRRRTEGPQPTSGEEAYGLPTRRGLDRSASTTVVSDWGSRARDSSGDAVTRRSIAPEPSMMKRSASFIVMHSLRFTSF